MPFPSWHDGAPLLTFTMVLPRMAPAAPLK